MKRKVLSIILAAALTGTMLAGCGSSAKQETPAAAADTGAAVSEQPAESSAAQTGASGRQTDGKNVPELTSEPLTITLWDISTEDPGKTTMEEAVQRFMADYPNITINQVHQQNDNYKQQLVVAMSSKQAPDMYIHWGGGPMAEYYKSGFVNDMTEMFSTYDHPDYIDAAVAQSTYDDKVLAIPFGGLSGCDIFYNKTILQRLALRFLKPSTIWRPYAIN